MCLLDDVEEYYVSFTQKLHAGNHLNVIYIVIVCQEIHFLFQCIVSTALDSMA